MEQPHPSRSIQPAVSTPPSHAVSQACVQISRRLHLFLPSCSVAELLALNYGNDVMNHICRVRVHLRTGICHRLATLTLQTTQRLRGRTFGITGHPHTRDFVPKLDMGRIFLIQADPRKSNVNHFANETAWSLSMRKLE